MDDEKKVIKVGEVEYEYSEVDEDGYAVDEVGDRVLDDDGNPIKVKKNKEADGDSEDLEEGDWDDDLDGDDLDGDDDWDDEDWEDEDE